MDCVYMGLFRAFRRWIRISVRLLRNRYGRTVEGRIGGRLALRQDARRVVAGPLLPEGFQ